eukprot:7094193-Pyramimonas_sp.AAC.1
MAKVLAESPSVRISVHREDCAVPARAASSSFGMPRTTFCFRPSVLHMSRISLHWLSALVSSTKRETQGDRSSLRQKSSERTPRAFAHAL